MQGLVFTDATGDTDSSAATFKRGIETVPRSAPPWLTRTGARTRAAPGLGLGGFSEDENIFGLCDF